MWESCTARHKGQSRQKVAISAHTAERKVSRMYAPTVWMPLHGAEPLAWWNSSRRWSSRTHIRQWKRPVPRRQVFQLLACIHSHSIPDHRLVLWPQFLNSSSRNSNGLLMPSSQMFRMPCILGVRFFTGTSQEDRRVLTLPRTEARLFILFRDNTGKLCRSNHHPMLNRENDGTRSCRGADVTQKYLLMLHFDCTD